MSGRLKDKIAIVTGSSSGLGRAIAIHYHHEGALLVCADLRPSAREEVPGETAVDTHDLIASEGGRAIFVSTDVGEAVQVEALIKKAVEEYGRIDILVNNAGISIESWKPAPVHETDESLWDTTMRVNAKSVFLGCKYGLAQMIAQDPHPSGDRGWVINMASIFGMVGGRDNPSYCASKGAVVNLTREMALDYAKYRIHINAICPGYTQTAIFAHTIKHMVSKDELDERHPFGGTGHPDSIARMAVVLASEDAGWMTGAIVPVDGGYTVG